jgi:uncharacterized protein YaaW (UPF0174 family)
MADFRNFVNRDAQWARFLMHRRDFLRLAAYAGAGLIVSPFSYLTSMAEEQVSPGKFAFDTLQERWGPERLNRFLELITDEDRLNLKKSLQLLKPEATVSQLRGKNAEINDILTQLLWVSSHWLPYLWRDEWSIDYHGTVCWCAGKLKLPKQDIQTLPTFALERKILEQLFIQMWDKLPPKEREKLLCQLDKNGCIQDKAAIAALSGAAALTALSTTVILSGFAFYTTMSSLICAVAGFFGITLPFGVYTTASSTVALLAGPVGWVLAAILAAIGLALVGRANVQKTVPFVVTLHCIKAEHMKNAGYKEKDIFGK